MSTVERFLEVWIYLPNKGSVNHNRISTRKLIIERKWWKIVTKNQKKGRSILKTRKDGEGAVIGKCSDSPMDQEVLCIQTKDDSAGLGRALPWLVFKECLPMLLLQSYTVIMCSLCSVDINFPT